MNKYALVLPASQTEPDSEPILPASAPQTHPRPEPILPETDSDKSTLPGLSAPAARAHPEIPTSRSTDEFSSPEVLENSGEDVYSESDSTPRRQGMSPLYRAGFEQKQDRILNIQREIDWQYAQAKEEYPDFPIDYDQLPKAEEITDAADELIENVDEESTAHGLFGVSASGGIGLSGGGSLNVVYDDYGNWGLAITVGIGGGLGASLDLPDSPLDALKQSISGGVSLQSIGGAETIWDLAGPGCSVGGTLFFASAELAGGQETRSFSAGFSKGLDFHAHITYTFIWPLHRAK